MTRKVREFCYRKPVGTMCSVQQMVNGKKMYSSTNATGVQFSLVNICTKTASVKCQQK